jgi:ABC-type branched-subunit amino acid transport system substrate-binding protein
VSRLLHLCLIGLCTLLGSPAFADITIGHVLTLTGPGAEPGRELVIGAKTYIDKVNAEGGVAGHRIIYLVRDDCGQPELALTRAAELIAGEQVLGLLAGADPARTEALVSSGVLRQNGVPMLGVKGGAGSPPALTGARQAGLVEIVPPQDFAPLLQREFEQALAQYGPGDAPPTKLTLEGYTAAKVLVGAIRLLGPEPGRGDFYAVVRNLLPDVGTRLVTVGYVPE